MSKRRLYTPNQVGAMAVTASLIAVGLAAFLAGLEKAGYLPLFDALVIYLFLAIGALALVDWMFNHERKKR